MAEPDRYGAAARKIAAESSRARDAYIAHCKTLTPEAFLQEPPERLRRLSLKEYLGIIRTILGQPQPAASRLPQPAAPASKPRRLRDMWRKVSVAKKAAIVAVSASVVLAVVPSIRDAVAKRETRAAAGTMNVDRWHPCRRLDPGQDRCIYRTRGALHWDYVAGRLAQDVSLLRRHNRHLPGPHVPAQASIIVFRPPHMR